MRYTNDDFIRLIDEVERHGGELVDDTCHADELTYEYEGRVHRVMTSGCEMPVVFVIPYDPAQPVMVTEPVLEPDPDRKGEWKDAKGNKRRTMRSKKMPDPDNPDRKIVVTQEVERPGEVTMVGQPGLGVLLPVTVCAVEDNLGMWPRFRHVIKDRGSR